MRFPKFTIGHWMIAVALLSLLLAMPWAIFPVLISFLLAISIAVICYLPCRIRLAVETSILLVLSVLSALGWQSTFYALQSGRASELASQASEWAATSNSPKDRAILRREAAWLFRRSASLRLIAIWKGLLHGPGYISGSPGPRDNVFALDVMWEIKRHEDAARKAHRSSLLGQ